MQSSMYDNMNGYMNENGIWPVAGALRAIFLIVPIVRMVHMTQSSVAGASRMW